MSGSPMNMIEKYLERVRVYLPIDSEDALTEIRTHLIEEAEALGQGKMTHGSVMLAIERFGDPKEAANAYAGIGKRVGPLPAEYVQPAIRIVLLLVALGGAFIIGAYVVGISIFDVTGITNFPFSIPVMVALSLLYAAVIIAGLSAIEKRESPPSEKTVLESFLGLGSDVFKPKGRLDAAGEVVLGVFFAMVLLLSPIRILFREDFLLFMNVIAILLLVDAMKGLLFFIAGENNLNLLFEVILGGAWVVLCMFLINIQWPLEQVHVFNGAEWVLLRLADIPIEIPGPFGGAEALALLWAIGVFIVVVTNMWSILVSSMKIAMYLNQEEDKGLWWQGRWGPERHPFLFLRRDSDQNQTHSDDETNYSDGHKEPDNIDET
ncbi:MAG: HAAS signaling domain-containing protein [Candidatus Thorarchaeota archaeon]